jgi:hypothetical protein
MAPRDTGHAHPEDTTALRRGERQLTMRLSLFLVSVAFMIVSHVCLNFLRISLVLTASLGARMDQARSQVLLRVALSAIVLHCL